MVNESAVDGRVEMNFQTGLSVEEARAKVALKLQTVETDDRRIFLDKRAAYYIPSCLDGEATVLSQVCRP